MMRLTVSALTSLALLQAKFVQLFHILLIQRDRLEVLLDPCGRDALRERVDSALGGPGDGDLARLDAVLARDLGHHCVPEKRRIGAAQRRVGLREDTLALAEGDELVLGKEWVQLDSARARRRSEKMGEKNGTRAARKEGDQTHWFAAGVMVASASNSFILGTLTLLTPMACKIDETEYPKSLSLPTAHARKHELSP